MFKYSLQFEVNSIKLVKSFIVLILFVLIGLSRIVYAAGNSFYVSTTGTADGDGSIDDPWNLQTALSQPAAVSEGDTIYLRGGTYQGAFTSTLSGTSESPITVRSYPDEWAKLDLYPNTTSDMFLVQGQFTHFRDFELTNSSDESDRGGFQLKAGQGNKFINMVIHDLGNNTFGNSGSDIGNEVYGSILYNNGIDGSGLSHHLYTQNESIDSPSKVQESIVFHSFAFGMHAYSGGSGLLDGIHMIGSIWFGNGLAQTTGDRKDNILVGGNNGADNILLQENYTWTPSLTTRSTALGRYGSTNGDVTLTDNYLIGEVVFNNAWDSVTMTGNTFSNRTYSGDFSATSLTDTGNTVLNSDPSSNVTVVRPNDYDADRANIVVYNWEGLNNVSVDVSNILEDGDEYEVRNAQNFFDTDGVLLSGTYHGENLTLPMSAGNDPAQPIMGGLIEASEMTGTEFNVYVLMPPLGTTVDSSNDNSEPAGSAGTNTFHPDARCHWTNPPETTWIKLEPTTDEGQPGIFVYWTQYLANKVQIKIDGGTGSYPWKISSTLNDGHEFLPNVQKWQNIMIKPINNCSEGDYGTPVNYNLYPAGWYNL